MDVFNIFTPLGRERSKVVVLFDPAHWHISFAKVYPHWIISELINQSERDLGFVGNICNLISFPRLQSQSVELVCVLKIAPGGYGCLFAESLK